MNKDFNIPPEGEKILKSRGIDPGTISKEQVNGLLKGLSPEDTKKLSALIQDKEALEQVLSSTKAQMLIKMFMSGGGKK